jgi:proteasome lid subunit RPN8/RPN11
MTVVSRQSSVVSQQSSVDSQQSSVISLKSSVIDGVVAHAREAAPAECCGLLLGTAACIVEAIPTRNLAESPTRFLIDPRQHIDGRRDARRRGLDVIGFYHSHPHSAAQPSERDRDEASYPDHLYLIVGLQLEPPDIRLFTPGDGNFPEVPFVRVD